MKHALRGTAPETNLNIEHLVMSSILLIPKLYMTLFQCIGDIMIQYCSIKRKTRVFGNAHVRIELLT